MYPFSGISESVVNNETKCITLWRKFITLLQKEIILGKENELILELTSLFQKLVSKVNLSKNKRLLNKALSTWKQLFRLSKDTAFSKAPKLLLYDDIRHTNGAHLANCLTYILISLEVTAGVGIPKKASRLLYHVFR